MDNLYDLDLNTFKFNIKLRVEPLLTAGWRIVTTCLITKEPLKDDFGGIRIFEDPLRFNKFVDETNGRFGIGIMMGHKIGQESSTNRFFALDFDSVHHIHGPYYQFLEILRKRFRTFPLFTSINVSPHGFHYIFQYDTDDGNLLAKNYKNCAGYNVDVISEGWYILVYPTPGYKWLRPPTDENIRILFSYQLRTIESILCLNDNEPADDYWGLEEKEFEPDNPYSSDEERAFFGI